MDISKETENEIKELQSLEQNLQAIMMQKQALQIEESEAENALIELKKSKSDVYKIAGNIMVKTPKDEIIKELNQKKEIASVRLKSFSKQEETLATSAEELRKRVLAQMEKK